MARIAAAISVGDLATKRVVVDCVGDGGDRNIHQGDAIAGKREGLVGRVWDGLTRCDNRRIDNRLVFRDIASNVKGTRARRKRGGETGELARGRGDKRRDGRIGTRDNVGLGEPERAVNYCNM